MNIKLLSCTFLHAHEVTSLAFNLRYPNSFPIDIFPTDISPMDNFPTENFPKDNFPSGKFPERAFFRRAVPRMVFRRFHKRLFDGCTSVDSTVTIVESTVILIIFKKKFQYFRCPFSATVATEKVYTHLAHTA